MFSVLYRFVQIQNIPRCKHCLAACRFLIVLLFVGRKVNQYCLTKNSCYFKMYFEVYCNKSTYKRSIFWTNGIIWEGQRFQKLRNSAAKLPGNRSSFKLDISKSSVRKWKNHSHAALSAKMISNKKKKAIFQMGNGKGCGVVGEDSSEWWCYIGTKRYN